MKCLLFSLFGLLVIVGCGSKEVKISDIDKRLVQKDKEYIYDIKMQDIVQNLNIKPIVFEKFPFISEDLPSDFNGHYSPEFYKKNKITVNASRMDKVDFWSLKNNPKEIDIIYTKDILLDRYKNITNDLFINLCYAHNITKQEQEILLSWLKNGGVLWIEGGLYNIDDELSSFSKIDKNMNFLGKKVYPHMIGLDRNKKSIVYDKLQNNAFFKDIKSLQINFKRYKQMCFLIEGKSIVASLDEKLVNISGYGKGIIISMLPFEYTTLYRDGELLRWKLIEVLKDKKLLNFKIKEKKEVKKEELKKKVEIKSTSVKKVNILREGSCIQLFSCFSYKKAKQELSPVQNLPLARIEKRGKVYTGRVGMYKYVKDARKTLKLLQDKYPDAFIRRCSLKK